MDRDDDDWTANPFADPAVTEATGPATAVMVPTEVTVPQSVPPPMYNTVAYTTSSPAAATPLPFPASGTASTTPLGHQTQLLTDREAQLAQKEEQLRQQQAALEQRERELMRRQGTGAQMPPNWPNFPKWMPVPFKPWVYHSIENDIPSENHTNMTHMFRLWHFVCLCYALNLLAAIAGTACASCDTPGANLGVAIAFFCLGIPASFQLWYRTLYNGMRKDRAVSFMVFFFVFGFQILAAGWFALGPPGTGACGWLATIQASRHSLIVGFFYVMSAIGWSVCTGCCIYMIVQIHAWYKGTDYTIDRAQGELYSGATTNATIRDGLRDTLLRGTLS